MPRDGRGGVEQSILLLLLLPLGCGQCGMDALLLLRCLPQGALPLLLQRGRIHGGLLLVEGGQGCMLSLPLPQQGILLRIKRARGGTDQGSLHRLLHSPGVLASPALSLSLPGSKPKGSDRQAKQ